MTKKELIETLLNHRNYLRESLFKKYFPEDYENLLCLDFPQNMSFSQKVYHYAYDDFELKLGICPVCGNRSTYRSFNDGYITYCSIKCSQNSKEVRERIERTNLERYGHICSVDGPECVAKKKETWENKYGKGIDNPAKAESVKMKMEKTCLKKYKKKHAASAKVVRDKIEATNLKKYKKKSPLGNKKVREKGRQTCLNKFGFEVASQSPEIQEKVENTCLKNHGVRRPMMSKKIQLKAQATCMRRYKKRFVLQVSTIRKRITQTNIERYGVANAFNIVNNKNNKKWTDSGPNLKFAKKLDEHNIEYEREFIILNRIYDFKIGNILIEINPSITHNSKINVFGGDPLHPEYHMNKYILAKQHGYHNICVWDWDNVDKIVNLFVPKYILNISELQTIEVSKQDANVFLEKYCITSIASDYNKNIGFRYNNEIVSLAVFENNIMKYFAFHKDYSVKNGFVFLIDMFAQKHDYKNIEFVVDCSKYDASEFLKIGFEINKLCNPKLHLYREYDKHIIGALSENVVMNDKFLPIYDCGYVELNKTYWW